MRKIVSRVYKQSKHSVATVIPKEIVEQAEIREGDLLVWKIKNGKIIIEVSR